MKPSRKCFSLSKIRNCRQNVNCQMHGIFHHGNTEDTEKKKLGLHAVVGCFESRIT
jgi:hypothetical protein